MQKGSVHTVAGWLTITAGVIWLLGLGALILAVLGFSVGFGLPQGAGAVRLWAEMAALGVPGLLAVAGGVCALKRRAWVLALIGSLAVIPTVVGIAAVILVAVSKNEFD